MNGHTPLPFLLINGHPTWQMPELPSLRKLPPRTTCWPFPTSEAALQRLPERSPLVLCLNGDWQFQLFDQPAAVTPTALAAGVWQTLAVPGNWTMQLRGQPAGERAFARPHYTNIQMPFAEPFPQVPEYIATGVYRTTITIPETWEAQRVVLHFGGCEGCLYVYLDGDFVGFNKDSRTPAEYEISSMVRPGATHELLCVNPRFSDASFLEDQDHWWQAGIHRDVYLYATPRTFVHDIAAQTELSSDLATATLQVRIITRSSPAAPPRGTVRAQLFDGDGRAVLDQPLSASVGEPRPSIPGFVAADDTAETTLTASVSQPRLWSAEAPQLYTLVVTLDTPTNTVSTALRLGFRTIEIKNRELRINNQPVLIHGMNRHDHSDEHGKVVGRELMELDARTMKAHNVNAVRTAHYPNDPYWLDLCDELGLYVVDEANLEHHALLRLSEEPRVSAAYLERVRNMVERDKNHPCVIAWSLGNESGYGPNHDAAAAWIRHVDGGRPLHYEGAISRFNNDHTAGTTRTHWGGGQAATDILCPMYPKIEDLVAWVTTSADPRPLIMCEYAHAMGNSSGSLADYYAAFDAYHGLQGGFIWEWLDHGIRKHTADDVPFWAYGGDFGDTPHDGNFVADGMVWPDRTGHPGLHEFMYLARPVRVTALNAGRMVFRLENRRFFTGLDDLLGTWRLVVEGDVVQRGELPELAAPPQSHVDVTLPISWPPHSLAFVEFEFTTRAATAWAPRGHRVAWDQFQGPAVAATMPLAAPDASVTAQQTDGQLVLALGEQRVVIDATSGELQRFGPQIVGGPVLNLRRAPTDNDMLQLIFGSDDHAVGLWRKLGLDQLACRLLEIGIVRDPEGAPAIRVRHAWTGRERWEDVEHTQTYTLVDETTLRITSQVRVAPDFRDLPRVGLQLWLSSELEQLTWYGRGPWDNYSDRKASSMVGLYSSTVTEQYVPYIMPQEHGHKTDARWLQLLDRAGHGLRVTSNALFEFNALHFSDADLAAAQHTPELTPRPEVFLRLDSGMRGLGTGLHVDTLPQYQLNEQEYQFTFQLTLV